MAKTSISKLKDNRAADRVEIVTLDAHNFDQFSHFCGRSAKYAEAYGNKSTWLQARFAEGMRYKLLRANERTAGFIEYIPGEYAWRGVAARAISSFTVSGYWGRTKARATARGS